MGRDGGRGEKRKAILPIKRWCLKGGKKGYIIPIDTLPPSMFYLPITYSAKNLSMILSIEGNDTQSFHPQVSKNRHLNRNLKNLLISHQEQYVIQIVGKST